MAYNRRVTLQLLFQYPAFRGVGYLVVAACFILVGFLGMIIVSHVLFSLGRKSTLYKKRQPVEGWSKRFYPAAILMMLLLFSLGLWLRTYL